MKNRDAAFAEFYAWAVYVMRRGLAACFVAFAITCGVIGGCKACTRAKPPADYAAAHHDSLQDAIAKVEGEGR